MRSRLVPGLALATSVLLLGGCSGQSGTPPASRADATAAPPQTALPSADAPTPAPADAVTPASLPEAGDLAGVGGVTWRAGDTSAAEGTEQLSVCQQTRLATLGPTATQVRRFTQGNDSKAVAVAMSFGDRATADQAYQTLTGWFSDCAAVLLAQDRTNGTQVVALRPVPVPKGEAQISEWAYASESGRKESESQGLIRIDNRIELIAMRGPRQDRTWRLEPGGAEDGVHPMVRTLPAAAQRLPR